MDKYLVKIPYSYSKYGTKSGFVYANSEEEALDLAYDNDLFDEEYYDDGESDDNDFDYENTEVTLYESDIDDVEIPSSQVVYNTHSQNSTISIPDYFLSNIHSL